MANPQNLVPNDQRTPTERRENARKAGKASGEARRRRKAFAEAFDVLLSKRYTDKNGQIVEGVEAMAAKVFQKAIDGDMKAVAFVRDTVGEMPIQKIETVSIPAEMYERVQSVLDSFSDTDGDGATDVQEEPDDQ